MGRAGDGPGSQRHRRHGVGGTARFCYVVCVIVLTRPLLSFVIVIAGLAPAWVGCSASTPNATATTATTATTTTTTLSPATPAATTTPVVGPPVFEKVPDDKRLLLIVTASVQGYVEPCGCTGDPLGGIARLGGVIDDARRAYGDRVFFVDGGDLLFEKPDDNAAVDRCQAQARTQLLMSTYKRFGLDATVVGPLDEVRGADFRNALTSEVGVYSLRQRGSLVLQRGGLQVLVLNGGADTTAAEINDTIAKRSSPYDAVVVLSQRTAKDSRALAAQLKGVDVVVVGQTGEAPVPPEKVGDATVVNFGWQAQHVGLVEIVLEGRQGSTPLALDDRIAVADGRKRLLDVRVTEIDKLLAVLDDGPTKVFQQQRRDRIAAERAALDLDVSAPMVGPHISTRALPLKRGMTEEPTAFAALKAYEQAIPVLVSSCEAGVVCPEPAAGVATYVGAQTCQACHAGAWDFWNKALVEVTATDATGKKSSHLSGHVKAWDTLVHAGRDKDRSCVGCHSAGFDLEGGACTTTTLVERQLTAVQCESCHGAGSAHVAGGGDKTKIARAVPETRCRECHLPPHIESAASFVYDERLLHILGDGHGAARRAAIVAQKKAP